MIGPLLVEVRDNGDQVFRAHPAAAVDTHRPQAPPRHELVDLGPVHAQSGSHVGDLRHTRGGIDLRFPHHENEFAQSAAAGQGFARLWMHNAWITVSGEKMSKSLANSMLVSEVVNRVRPIELRYYLVSSHYRSSVEFSFEALEEAGAGFRRIENFLTRAGELGDVEVAADLPTDFAAAMDDDLASAAGLAVVHEIVRAGNVALNAADPGAVLKAASQVRAMLAIFGVDPVGQPWASRAGSSSGDRSVIDALVAALLRQPQDARARKDFASADAVRDQLREAGVEVEDTDGGPRWTVRR